VSLSVLAEIRRRSADFTKAFETGCKVGGALVSIPRRSEMKNDDSPLIMRSECPAHIVGISALISIPPACEYETERGELKTPYFLVCFSMWSQGFWKLCAATSGRAYEMHRPGHFQIVQGVRGLWPWEYSLNSQSQIRRSPCQRPVEDQSASKSRNLKAADFAICLRARRW